MDAAKRATLFEEAFCYVDERMPTQGRTRDVGNGHTMACWDAPFGMILFTTKDICADRTTAIHPVDRMGVVTPEILGEARRLYSGLVLGDPGAFPTCLRVDFSGPVTWLSRLLRSA